MISICHIIALVAAGSIGFQVESKRDFIIAELIHGDSYMSPSNATSHDRINNLNSSLHDIVARDVESEITFNKGGYLMKINVGGQNLLLVVTTGSDSTWMQCEPCEDCYEQDAPLFLPSSADGYKKFLSKSTECRMLRNDNKIVLELDKCGYKLSYRKKVSKVSITAILSRATSSFDSTESRLPFYFGCVHQSSGKMDGRAQGMVGLGYGDYSLITQLGWEFKIAKIFTYCLLPYGATSYSKIIFGNKATISTEKVTTPFNTKYGLPYYYLSLVRVKVNNQFQYGMPGDVGLRHDNIIIDSGTMMTSLPRRTYDDLADSVKTIVGSDPVHHEEFGLCFHDTHRIMNVKITLMFDEADVTLGKDNVFIEISLWGRKVFCMAIEPAEEGSFPVLGAYVQHGFAVEYNLENDKVSFAKADCYRFGRVTPVDDRPGHGADGSLRNGPYGFGRGGTGRGGGGGLH